MSGSTPRRHPASGPAAQGLDRPVRAPQLAGEPIETKRPLRRQAALRLADQGLRRKRLVRRAAVRHRGDIQDLCESFRGAEHLLEIQRDAQAIVSSLFGEATAAADGKAAAELIPHE